MTTRNSLTTAAQPILPHMRGRRTMHGVKDLKVSYGTSTLNKIRVLPRAMKDDDKYTSKKAPLRVLIKDCEYETSDRFWHSLASRFSISEGIFRYFDHAEVFNRITQRVPNDKLRLCIEESGSHTPSRSGLPRLLAVGLPDRAALDCEPVLDIMRAHGGTAFDYHNGMLRARFQPVSGRELIQIVGEDFKNSFQLEVPVDGYGRPKTFLELIKQVCMNGMIGYAQAFRSEINTVCKNPLEVLERALGSYDNDQGFAELQKRCEQSAHSWASVGEAQKLYKLLAQCTEGRAELKNLNKLTGDLPVIYGMTNLDAISQKRQSVLPTKAKVFDLITFATEVSTHKIQHPQVRRSYDAFVGTLISSQYDLEGSVDQVPQFEQFFTQAGPISAKAMKSKRTA